MRIFIDAGHGGLENAGRSTARGARGPMGTLEKDVTLDVARRVVARLGGDAHLVRDADTNMPLGARAERAARNGADVFVSLHASARGPDRSGPETFVHPQTGPQSRQLAAAIQRSLEHLDPRLGGGRGTSEGRLAVLSPRRLGSAASACLVEMDTLSNPRSERRLRDVAHRDAISQAIAGAIQEHVQRSGGAHAIARPLSVHPVTTRILELVDASPLVTYAWTGRGVAPIGFLKGMALTYGRVYCKHELAPGEPENWRDRFTVKMAEGASADASERTDAIARYRATMLNFGADLSFSVAVLRALFTILFGLGMRESSGKHCVGWDRGKLTGWGDPANAVVPTATNSEAGLFQMSYDIGVGVAGDFKDLYETYKRRPDSGFLHDFADGVACSANEQADFGAGPGQEFQRFSKECPAFTVELAALALRTRANHWGPINRNTVELRQDCWSLLLDVEGAVDDLGGCVALV